MKVLNKLVLKDLKSHKKRTIATLIGITLACTLMFTLGIAFSCYRENQIEIVKHQNGAHHVLYESVPYPKETIIKNTKQVQEYYREIVLQTGTFPAEILNHTDQTNEFTLMALQDRPVIDPLTIVTGRKPERETEVMLSRMFCLEHELEVGDTITLELPEEKTHQIVGIYQQIQEKEIVYTYQKEIQEGDVLNYYVTFKHGKQIKQAFSLAEKLGFTFVWTGVDSYTNTVLNTPLLELYGETQDATQYALMVLLLMLVLFIVGTACVIIIYNSFAISVNEKQKLFGTFASIGATPKQIRHAVLFEATLLILIALPFAFLLSIGIASIFLVLLNQILAHILLFPLSFALYLPYILICMAGIIVIIFLSSFSPAIRASEISPMVAIRQNKEIKLNKKRMKTGSFWRKIFGMEGEFARKNMKRNKAKYFITTLSLTIGFVLFMLFSIFFEFYMNSIKTGSYSNKVNIAISSFHQDSELSKKLLEDVSKLSSVKQKQKISGMTIYTKSIPESHYTPAYYQEAGPYFLNRDGFMMLNLVGLDEESFARYQKEIGTDKKFIFLNQSIIVKYNDQDEETRKILPILKSTVPIDLGKLEPIGEKNWNIIYTYVETQFTIDDYFMTTKHYSLEKASPSVIPTMIVSEKTKAKIEAVLEESNAIRNKEHQLEIIPTNFKEFDREYKKYANSLSTEVYQFLNYQNYGLELQNIKAQFQTAQLLIYSVLFFLLLIIITTIYNTINTSMELRKREFAMLASIGMTPRSFRKLMTFESFYLCFKAFLWGMIGTGLILFVLLNIFQFTASVSGQTLTIQKFFQLFPFPFMQLCFAIVILILLTLAITIYSIKKIENQNMIEIIKGDSM